MATKRPPGTLERLWADPANWRAHFIYVCKDDPRIFVPKRHRLGGWTVNFAHASAWVALLICALSIVVPTVLLARAGLIGTPMWFAFLLGIIAFWCALSWIASSPKRYENGR